MYVCSPRFSLSTRIICIICIKATMMKVSVDRLKKDGKTKYVKLLCKGILILVDWNLPFCSVKQSQAVRKKAGVTEFMQLLC